MTGRAYIADLAKRDIAELVSMLHEMYALAVDASGYDNAEKRDIKLRANMLLHKHGVEV